MRVRRSSTRARPYRHHRARRSRPATQALSSAVRPSCYVAYRQLSPAVQPGVASPRPISSAASAGTAAACRGRSCRIWTDRIASGSSVGFVRAPCTGTLLVRACPDAWRAWKLLGGGEISRRDRSRCTALGMGRVDVRACHGGGATPRTWDRECRRLTSQVMAADGWMPAESMRGTVGRLSSP
ncbi:hypothetical protein PAHAL_9G410300 [Panicum hallii]|uniref:Uncharacterized protein n=1 Tax=Panicum hallii TaxID=206008 RepID=A0A2T8I481_9POAL|nr:hypothetical protein PAHAL_9G410300 [Panicum hallii]